jgi:hypothetical protein
MSFKLPHLFFSHLDHLFARGDHLALALYAGLFVVFPLPYFGENSRILPITFNITRGYGEQKPFFTARSFPAGKIPPVPFPAAWSCFDRVAKSPFVAFCST